MAKVATVTGPVVRSAQPAKGGKPVGSTVNLAGLQAALMAYSRQASGRGGSVEETLLDGRTYDQLAEDCLDAFLENGIEGVVILVEGVHFRMDAQLKSIQARIQRALAGGASGGSRKDELHKLTSYEVRVKAFDAVKDFSFTNPETGKMETTDIPNTLYVTLNPGIAEKAEQWATIREQGEGDEEEG